LVHWKQAQLLVGNPWTLSTAHLLSDRIVRAGIRAEDLTLQAVRAILAEYLVVRESAHPFLERRNAIIARVRNDIEILALELSTKKLDIIRDILESDHTTRAEVKARLFQLPGGYHFSSLQCIPKSARTRLAG
jgi:hypothetical protein